MEQDLQKQLDEALIGTDIAPEIIAHLYECIDWLGLYDKFEKWLRDSVDICELIDNIDCKKN